MKDRVINILGVSYAVNMQSPDINKKLDGIDGYCDYTSHTIVITTKNDNVDDLAFLQRKTLRHEIIHAFLAESGLQANFQHAEQYGHEETMVDWFAIQYPKIHKVFKELKILR